MSQFILNYPDSLPGLLKKSHAELEEDLRFIIAGKLYDMGKLSCGKSAEIAGVSRLDFLRHLGNYGFHAINLDGEEIEAELQTVREITA